MMFFFPFVFCVSKIINHWKDFNIVLRKESFYVHLRLTKLFELSQLKMSVTTDSP